MGRRHGDDVENLYAFRHHYRNCDHADARTNNGIIDRCGWFVVWNI